MVLWWPRNAQMCTGRRCTESENTETALGKRRCYLNERLGAMIDEEESIWIFVNTERGKQSGINAEVVPLFASRTTLVNFLLPVYWAGIAAGFWEVVRCWFGWLRSDVIHFAFSMDTIEPVITQMHDALTYLSRQEWLIILFGMYSSHVFIFENSR